MIAPLGVHKGSSFLRALHKIVVFRFREKSVHITLLALEMLGSQYVRAFDFEHIKIGRDHAIILKHWMERKWSIFGEEFLSAAFREILGLSVRQEVMENQAVTEFQTP